MTEKFNLVSDYPPQGDQPQAIKKLVEGISNGYKHQTLLGVTGSGKTFTMANVIQKVQLPTLVISHNKTLAAQLCSEFRRYFHDNAVEYFVSYYDYYQHEAYIACTDTYIEKVVLVSATPAKYELEKSKQIVEQIIRPTGLIDPEIILKPAKNQIDSLIAEIKKRTEKKERVLVTTLTKRMAEDVAEYLEEINIKAKYLHSEIKTLERINILKDLRLGKFNVLVGVNLLREGLDLPEVSLVAILDADKEGFLRSETSLIQTMGRAARNINGTVILYCENSTGSIRRAVKETNRRRKIQLEYNRKYQITPKTIIKTIDEFAIVKNVNNFEDFSTVNEEHEKYLSKSNLWLLIKSLEKEMKQAAKNLDFERAALLRDEIRRLKKEKTLFGGKISGSD